MVEQPGFWTGFLSGFVAAGLVGFLSQRLRLALKDYRAAYQPQKVVTPTKRTPAQVMRSSTLGLLRVLWWLLIILAAAALAYLVLTGQLG
jgi:hypothetical protein